MMKTWASGARESRSKGKGEGIKQGARPLLPRYLSHPQGTNIEIQGSPENLVMLLSKCSVKVSAYAAVDGGSHP